MVTASVVEAMTEPMCPRCLQAVLPDDTVAVEGSQVTHLDCRQPRDLIRQERALMFVYCWGHAAECPACGRSVRLFELDQDRFKRDKTMSCPRCQADLIDRVREHLYACPVSPEVLRHRAREARANTQQLAKQICELRDQADVLMRNAEVAASELRDATKQSASDALQRAVRVKLREGRLPHVDVPAPILGLPGDGSKCAACDQPIYKHHLMIVLASGVTPFPLHAIDCFPLWDEERRTSQLSA